MHEKGNILDRILKIRVEDTRGVRIGGNGPIAVSQYQPPTDPSCLVRIVPLDPTHQPEPLVSLVTRKNTPKSNGQVSMEKAGNLKRTVLKKR